MKPCLAIAFFFLLTNIVAPAAIAQEVTCACAKVPKSTCEATITCQDGCTALCGAGDTCYLACRNPLLPTRITAKFDKKQGQEIADDLSVRIHRRIEFIPQARYQDRRYTLELKGENIWNVCNILSKHGTVKIGGTDFEKFKVIQRGLRNKRGRISVNFSNTSVKDALALLSFMSGVSLRLTSGDPDQMLSLSLRQVTLDEALERISAVANGRIQK